MSSSQTMTFWTLTVLVLLHTTSASPVVAPSSPEYQQRYRADPNPDLIPPPDGIPVGDRARLPPFDTYVAGDDEDDELGIDFDDEDDADIEFDDDVAMEEEIFKKLKGNTTPKRVVKMLQEISKDEDFMTGKGNTVRSYMPVKREKCAGLGAAYVFSMLPTTALNDPESLKYAELHFYAKNFLTYPDHPEVGETVPIAFYYVKASECHPLGIQHLKIPKNGWLVSNVTSLLTHALIDDTEKVTIAMYIGGSEDGDVGQPLGALPHHDREKLVKPFVFVYTEDAATGKGDAQLNWERIAERLASRSTEMPPDSPSDIVPSAAATRRRRSIRVNATATATTTTTTTGADGTSNDEIIVDDIIDDNEYPLLPVGKPPNPAITHTAFTFFAEQNMRRIKSNRRRARNQRKKENSKNMLLEPVDDDKARSKKKKLNKPRPKHLDRERPAVLANRCQRHAMNVDFQRLGWDDQVIAPASFDAYYCSGECEFPMSNDLHPSNHAVIQSLMHVLRLQSGVPNPCCVPEKMEPLSILYVDLYSNVSLKKYTDMQVLSCGCH